MVPDSSVFTSTSVTAFGLILMSFSSKSFLQPPATKEVHNTAMKI